MKRLSLLVRLIVFLTIVFNIGISESQPYPNRPIQLVIASTTGSAADLIGRLLAEELKKSLGVQVIALNKAGAAFTVGTDAVAKSKKDGYTIAYTSSSALVYAPVTNMESVPYDPFKDLEPLGMHVVFPNAIAVQEASPFRRFSDMVDYAKKNPGNLRISTIGIGSTPHFDLALIEHLTGAQFTMIPFKGGPPALTALLGGHVEATLNAVSLVSPHVNSGKLRFLLLTNKMRQFSDVPVITEIGYKQDLLIAWFALYAPSGIPESTKKVLVAAIEKAVTNPSQKSKVEELGFIVDYKSPAELAKMTREDYDKAKSLVTRMDLRTPPEEKKN
jgi:tripartite-type tricarboxylate transporter receptor subunit TctC